MTENTDLIVYRELYCGDYFAYKSNLVNLCRYLRKELGQARFVNQAKFMSKEPFFTVFISYQKCYDVLGSLAKMHYKIAYLGDIGFPFYKIRKYCQKKDFDGYLQCDEF